MKRKELKLLISRTILGVYSINILPAQIVHAETDLILNTEDSIAASSNQDEEAHVLLRKLYKLL